MSTADPTLPDSTDFCRGWQLPSRVSDDRLSATLARIERRLSGDIDEEADNRELEEVLGELEAEVGPLPHTAADFKRALVAALELPPRLPADILELPLINGLNFDPHCFKAWVEFFSTRDAEGSISGWVNSITDVAGFKAFLRDFCAGDGWTISRLEVEGQLVELGPTGYWD